MGQRSPVCDLDIFLNLSEAEHLLGEMQGVVLALFKGNVRVRKDILQCNQFLAGKTMACPHIHMRIGVEERSEFQVPVAEQLVHHLIIALIDVENPQIAAERSDILNNLIGLCLSQTEIVFRHSVLFHEHDKSIHDKRIMLGRHGKIDRAALLPGVPVLHKFSLFNNLPGITQKFHPFG
ncbi:hypothetical protein D3C81_1585190 [compost metagenome]